MIPEPEIRTKTPVPASAGTCLLTFLNFFIVFGQNSRFNHLPGFIIKGVRCIPVRPVFPLLARHRHKQSIVPVDDLQISDDETMVEGDGDIGFEPILLHRKYPYLCHIHIVPPARKSKMPTQGRVIALMIVGVPARFRQRYCVP